MGEIKLHVDFVLNTLIDHNNVSVVKLVENSYVVSGNYTNNLTKNPIGIFFCKINNKVCEPIKYFAFQDLTNFYSHLSIEDRKTVKENIIKNESNGNDGYLIDRLSAHEIIEVNDGYLLINEFFGATFNSSANTIGQGNAQINGKTNTYTANTTYSFSGTLFTNAIILKIGKDGNLLWDQNVEMNLRHDRFFPSYQLSIFEKTDNSIVFFFVDRSNIVSKIFDKNGLIKQEIESKKIENDNYKNIEYAEIKKWYDNNFLYYGVSEGKTDDNKILESSFDIKLKIDF